MHQMHRFTLTHRTTLIASVALIWLLTALSERAFAGARQRGGYRIRLQRPMKVGQRYKVSMTLSKRTRTLFLRLTGRILGRKDERYSIDYQAQVQVLKVDSLGRPTRERHRIARFVKNARKSRRTLLAPGTVVTAWVVGKKEHFQTSQGPVPKAIADDLALVTDLAKGGASDDVVFGTSRRQKIGSRWRINARAARKDLERMFGVQSVPASTRITGHMKLKRRGRVDGEDCLLIDGQMTTTGFGPQLGNIIVRRAEMTFGLSGWFPLDLVRSRRRDRITLRTTLLVQTNPYGTGVPTQVETKTEMDAQRRFKPLPPAARSSGP